MLLYRDLFKPNPIWEEVGIYGGYKWIALDASDSIWIHRKWEPYLLAMQSNLHNNGSCDFHCFATLQDMLSDTCGLAGALPSYINAGETLESWTSFAITRKYYGDAISPTFIQSDNNLRLARLLQTSQEFAIVGYSSELEQLLQTISYKHIFTTTVLYKLPRCEVLSEKSLLPLTNRTITIIPSDRYDLKRSVRNWANIVNI